MAIIEPDSLANLVTNLNVAKCANAQSAYKVIHDPLSPQWWPPISYKQAGITYAMQQLDALGVYMYLDAGNAGGMGWPANLASAAAMFSQMLSAAGLPKFVRGLSTNVSNYNALGAFSHLCISDHQWKIEQLRLHLTQSRPEIPTTTNFSTSTWVFEYSIWVALIINFEQALAPALVSAGFPAHFIVDQGRSGVQNIRNQWGDWCNVKGAGFGTRPTLSTPNTTLIDSIVWVKPGGESDGTSNTSSPRYDSHCSASWVVSN